MTANNNAAPCTPATAASYAVLNIGGSVGRISANATWIFPR